MGARLLLAVLAVWMTLLSGCNTMHGVGRDIEAAGEAIQKKTR
jgi:predicted small secreted protein